MTDLAPVPGESATRESTTERIARPRHYLMTRPDHFAVTYAINPWMTPGAAVDHLLAQRQWEGLRDTYRSLGHEVEVLDGLKGLPDMVFAANGALVAGDATIAAKFAHAERTAEAPAYAAWLEAAGFGPVHQPRFTNEGEGDFLVVGQRILAGTGFRTTPEAHNEVAAITGLEVVTLELVDPRYYHLDTALAVLTDDLVAYYPGAFSPVSLATLQRLYPDAILAHADDAAVLGLNAVSDGRHVVIAEAAHGLARDLELRGFVPVPVDLSEFLKGGGGIKCCTLELRERN